MLKKLFYLMVCAALAACSNGGSDEPVEPEKEVLTLDKHRFEVAAEGGTVSVKVTGNVDYTVTVPEAFRSWISEESAKVAGTHSFAVSENEELDGREGYIVFAGGTLKDTVYVVQAAGVGKDFTETVSGVSFDMVYVKGGTFQMGATEEQGADYDSDEKPVHSVTLSDYYIGKFEVTQELWKAVMGTSVIEQAGNNRLRGVGDDNPMYYVSWNDSQEFVTKLSELTGKKYVLPTEAQWEYAARGGAKSKGYKYSGSNTIDDVAWYDSNSESKTHPVGMKSPNELGIYDMCGNVDEWCSDWFGSYSEISQTDPHGPESGYQHIGRGGNWYFPANSCRVSVRYGDFSDERFSNGGSELYCCLSL